MTIYHHIVLARLGLFLSVLLAPVSFAQASLDDAGYPTGQAPSDDAFLPEGIEATGDTAEARSLSTWAAEHQHSHPERAEKAARRALTIARNVKDFRGVGLSLTTLGNLASDLHRKEGYYEAAREAFEQDGDEQGLIRSRLNMGNVHERRGELKQALTAYFDALRGLVRLGKREGRAVVLNNIGAVHRGQGNLEEALGYFERAAALAETVDKPAFLASILNSLGSTLSKKGAYEEAEIYLRRALAIAEEEGLRRTVAYASNNLGFLFNKQGRYRLARPHLATAEILGNELGDAELLVAVYDEFGKMYMGLGQYDQGRHYATESLSLAREEGLFARQMDAHQTLSEIHEGAGNFEQALAHHRQHAAMRDSVFNTEKAEIITEMQTRYETEEKQRTIERFEQENQIQVLRQTLLLVSVGGLLLLLGFLYNRYRLKRRSNRLLEDLDAAKSRFFANISHEFRTPLTVILGSMRDALAGRFGETTASLSEQHEAVLRNTQRLQRLVDEVLNLNRLEAGQLELKPAPGDLVGLLRRLVEADAPLAERKGIALTFEHDVEHCPRLYDAEKLEKVVGNLLSNALKFTPKEGRVRVGLQCEGDVEIWVSDDGPGIPAAMQENVFERFAQVEDGALHGGAGIGLSLAKELAELHGGTITLESEPGEGSTFTVRLPLEEATLEDVQGNTPRPFGTSRPEGGMFGPQTAPLRGLPAVRRDGGVSVTAKHNEDGNEAEPDPSMQNHEESDRTTVLVIEDNADVRAYVRRSLEEPYRVLEAADGELGLQQAREALPDLIVSDVMLPGVDGYEIARQLKAEPATECIPVVMLTARAAEEDQVEGYGSGAEVYITKPFTPETLRAAVGRLLEERRRLRRWLEERAEEEEALRNGHPTLRERARAAVLEHLHEEGFGVKELAASLGMSRYALHHRLKQEIDLPPSDFVRTLRLERARELLSDGAGSVSEVAYAVGFNSLSVFSRNYRAHYGTPPSSHLERG